MVLGNEKKAGGTDNFARRLDEECTILRKTYPKEALLLCGAVEASALQISLEPYGYDAIWGERCYLREVRDHVIGYTIDVREGRCAPVLEALWTPKEKEILLGTPPKRWHCQNGKWRMKIIPLL